MKENIMLKMIVMIVVLVIIGVMIFAATKPNTFRTERSASIKATPEKIYALLQDFHEWEVWSPWEKIDPAINRTYSGSTSGKGAIYEWSGNKEIGQGRMEIIEATMPTKLVIKISFFKPFEAHNTVEFILSSQGENTQVTQAMYGPSPYISKLMCFFFDMDKMVGGKQAEGLATIKEIAEK